MAAFVRSTAAVALVIAAAASLLSLRQLIYWVAPGELVWPISADMWALVVFVFAFLVIIAVGRVIARGGVGAGAKRGGRRGTIDALTGGPIVLLLGLSAAARLAVQLAGFAFLHPTALPVPFTVVATTHSRSHAQDYYYLRLRYGAAGRVFSDRVDQPVYAAARDGDSVILPVETGRFGVQRAMVTTRLAVGDLHHPL